MRILVVIALVSLCACATSDPGWTGEGATPFDTAQTNCEIETENQNNAAFEACMASNGWTRPQE